MQVARRAAEEAVRSMSNDDELANAEARASVYESELDAAREEIKALKQGKEDFHGEIQVCSCLHVSFLYLECRAAAGCVCVNISTAQLQQKNDVGTSWMKQPTHGSKRPL